MKRPRFTLLRMLASVACLCASLVLIRQYAQIQSDDPWILGKASLGALGTVLFGAAFGILFGRPFVGALIVLLLALIASIAAP